jgi:GNAT superfamily N-acetyltransferase
VETRIATDTDLDRATEVLTSAFEHDPVWSWAFPEREALAAWWRLYVRSALGYCGVWILGDFAAVASWIPPGENELSAEDEALVDPLVRELAGARAPEVLELLERFGSSRPEDPPHYYLSLLGTDRAQRGHGYGMELLERNLALIDSARMPAYLESSNPDNCPRYERRGFRRVGQFERPDRGLTIPTMWREAAGGP